MMSKLQSSYPMIWSVDSVIDSYLKPILKFSFWLLFELKQIFNNTIFTCFYTVGANTLRVKMYRGEYTKGEQNHLDE